MKTYLIILSFIIPTSIYAQSRKTKELKYFLSYFIDSVCNNECSNNNIYISQQIHNIDIPFCADIKNLKNFDSTIIKNHFRDTSAFNFDVSFFQKKKVIPFIQIPESYKTQIKKQEGIAYSKDCLYFVSSPLFLSNYQYCLFTYVRHYNNCKTILLKKRNNKWFQISTICSWKSSNVF